MACPNCGMVERASSEKTLSGKATDAQYDWALYLLTGLIMDALGRDHTEEAERLLRLALSSVDNTLAAGQALIPGQLDGLVEALLMLMQRGGGSVALLQRTLAAYARRQLLPSPATMEAIGALAPTLLTAVASSVGELLSGARVSSSAMSDQQMASFRTLESLHRELGGAEGS